jgi:hypothetical protein
MNNHLIKELYILAFATATLAGCSTKEVNAGGRAARILAWAPERDPALRSLLKARYDAAVSAYNTNKTLLEAGKSTSDLTLRLADWVADAECDLAETPEQLIHALEKHLEITKQFELEEKRTIYLGALPPSRESLMRCWRLAAEVDLFRAKRHFKSDHHSP